VVNALTRTVVGLFRNSDDFSLVFRGASTYMVIRVAGLVLNFAAQFALVRWMGSSEYGVFANARAWAYLLALPSGLGLTIAMLRFAPEYQAQRDWARLGGYMRFSMLVLTAVSVTVAVAAVGVVLSLDLPLERKLPLVVGVVAVPALTLNDLFVQTGRSFGRISATFSLSMIGSPVLLIVLTGVLWLRDAPIDAILVTAVFLAAQIMVVGAQVVNGRRITPTEVKAAASRYEPGRWIRVSLPLILFSGFVSITQYLDITMLGFYVTPDQIGIYDIAVKITGLLSFVMVSVASIGAPRFSYLYASRDLSALQALVNKVVHLAFWPIVVGVGIMILAGGEILEIFGPDFRQGETALGILAASYVFWAATTPAGYLLTTTGHQHRTFLPYLGALGAKIALNAVLIPRFGIEGAAIAHLVVIAGLNLLLAHLVHRHLSLKAIIFARS
jgi:O-antigen/teichoic acid export membrane protein